MTEQKEIHETDQNDASTGEYQKSLQHGNAIEKNQTLDAKDPEKTNSATDPNKKELNTATQSASDINTVVTEQELNATTQTASDINTVVTEQVEQHPESTDKNESENKEEQNILIPINDEAISINDHAKNNQTVSDVNFVSTEVTEQQHGNSYTAQSQQQEQQFYPDIRTFEVNKDIYNTYALLKSQMIETSKGNYATLWTEKFTKLDKGIFCFFFWLVVLIQIAGFLVLYLDGYQIANDLEEAAENGTKVYFNGGTLEFILPNNSSLLTNSNANSLNISYGKVDLFEHNPRVPTEPDYSVLFTIILADICMVLMMFKEFSQLGQLDFLTHYLPEFHAQKKLISRLRNGKLVILICASIGSLVIISLATTSIEAMEKAVAIFFLFEISSWVYVLIRQHPEIHDDLYSVHIDFSQMINTIEQRGPASPSLNAQSTLSHSQHNIHINQSENAVLSSQLQQHQSLHDNQQAIVYNYVDQNGNPVEPPKVQQPTQDVVYNYVDENGNPVKPPITKQEQMDYKEIEYDAYQKIHHDFAFFKVFIMTLTFIFFYIGIQFVLWFPYKTFGAFMILAAVAFIMIHVITKKILGSKVEQLIKRELSSRS